MANTQKQEEKKKRKLKTQCKRKGMGYTREKKSSIGETRYQLRDTMDPSLTQGLEGSNWLKNGTDAQGGDERKR